MGFRFSLMTQFRDVKLKHEKLLQFTGPFYSDEVFMSIAEVSLHIYWGLGCTQLFYVTYYSIANLWPNYSKLINSFHFTRYTVYYSHLYHNTLAYFPMSMQYSLDGIFCLGDPGCTSGWRNLHLTKSSSSYQRRQLQYCPEIRATYEVNQGRLRKPWRRRAQWRVYSF